MWSKKGTPVSIVLCPVPSSDNSTRTMLSLVSRSIRAILVMFFLLRSDYRSHTLDKLVILTGRADADSEPARRTGFSNQDSLFE